MYSIGNAWGGYGRSLQRERIERDKFKHQLRQMGTPDPYRPTAQAPKSGPYGGLLLIALIIAGLLVIAYSGHSASEIMHWIDGILAELRG